MTNIMEPRTLFQKVWDDHVVVQEPDRPAVLYIDLQLIHEVTSPQAFSGLRERGLRVRRPDKTIATMDHSTPTLPKALWVIDDQAKAQLAQLERNCEEFGIELFRLGDSRNGIVHVIGPERGFTQPGKTIVCGDSHTSTHGAFGALAFGIGTMPALLLFGGTAQWLSARARKGMLRGAGLLVAALGPARPGLEERVLSYVPEVAMVLGSGGVTRPAAAGRWWGDRQVDLQGSLERRLADAGLTTTVSAHRRERLRWGAVGLTCAAIGWMVAGLDPMRHGAGLVLALAGAFATGVVACEVRLIRDARRRQHRMTAELPELAEQLSWALWAGLPLDAAIARVIDHGEGVLVDELSRLDALSGDGLRLSAALRVLGGGPVPLPVERYLVSLGVALERGSPTTDVSASQAMALLDRRRRRRQPGWAAAAMGVVVVGWSTLLALATTGGLGWR